MGVAPPRVLGLLSLNGEPTLPAWYSSSAWVLCGLLTALVAAGKRSVRDRYAWHWIVLAAIFVLLSIDEAVSLHERTTARVQTTLGAGGFLHFAWVVPGAAFVAVFVLAYLGFLRHLPARTRRLFVAAGAIFVAGAIGGEMLSGYYFSRFGRDTLAYALLTTVEESLEMLGVALFVYGLLDYMAREVGMVEVRLRPAPAAPARLRAVVPSGVADPQ